ncbi:MAG: hydrogenase formation protein HypD [Lachnospiraceae bacterium]|nr:hydrogenase formation protein HypD [Candidatus Minthocola equi]
MLFQTFDKKSIESLGKVRLMEVCGTHTMSFARSGIKSLLPDNIKLLSGPGCPVCVTPDGAIDSFLELSDNPDIIIATYGDMIRVPGSKRGDNLASRRARGAHVEVVYSPIDAIDIAAKNPDKEVVFLGVGFETTAPGTGAAIGVAAERGVNNFSVLSLLKRVEPSLRALIESPDFSVNGFIVPGHVAVILGEEGFRFLSEDYNLPGVVAGFETEDITVAIEHLIAQMISGNHRIENKYERLVRPDGNPAAKTAISKFFEPCDAIWRGLGFISDSGYKIREEYASYDAAEKFNIDINRPTDEKGCCCGEVIKGAMSPTMCPLFGTACTPEDAVGPCMVSSEGACAAAYKYQRI